MKNERKDSTSKLFNKLKHLLQLNILCFFSDEKNVCQDQIVNSQNNCWLALSPQDIPKVMKSKYPVQIMMFGVVTSNSDVMPPIIFPHGLTLNTEVCIKYLEKLVITRIERCPWCNCYRRRK